MSVTYVRTAKNGVPDYATAVVEIVSTNPVPTDSDTKAQTLSGWALKHGFDFCTWKKRFLRLDSSTLRYYKGPSSNSPKGVIQLSPYCVCRAVEVGEERPANSVSYVKMVQGQRVAQKVQRPNGLIIQVPAHERTYGLHFTTVESRDMWLNAINVNIELLRRAAGVIEEMIEKVTPLADAGTVPREKVGIIKMALRGRFNPLIDLTSTDPFTKTLIAVAMSDLGAVQTSLKPEHLSQRTSTGSTLLIKACTVGNVDVVRFLLTRGADPNVTKANDGDTPLIVAARLNHIKVVRLLLEHDANRLVTNVLGESPQTEGRHKGDQITTMLTSYFPEKTTGTAPALLPGVLPESVTAVAGVQRTHTMSALSPEQLKVFIAEQQAALVAAQDALAQAQHQPPASVIMPPNAAASLQELSSSLKSEPIMSGKELTEEPTPEDPESDEDPDFQGAFQSINLAAESVSEDFGKTAKSLGGDIIELAQ